LQYENIKKLHLRSVTEFLFDKEMRLTVGGYSGSGTSDAQMNLFKAGASGTCGV